MLWLVLRTLIGHWRRRPFQAISLLIGLAVATALFAGVQALNAEARASYDRAESLLGADLFDEITARGGRPIALDDYIALRRAGWRVSPVIEGTILVDGRAVTLIGIDPLTLPPAAVGAGLVQGADGLTSFLAPPWQLFASPATVAALAEANLPPLTVAEAMPANTLLADIAYAADRLARADEITRLVVAPTQKPDLPAIDAVTDGRLVLTPPTGQSDLGSLTDSFHLNLTAFGLLSFVVGLFIVNATVGLAFEQRRPLLRTLRALGVSERRLSAALLIELLLLATLGGVIGIVLGYVMAAALLPDVAASLGGLYGAPVPGTLSLSPLWWLGGLAISLAGALLAAASSFWKARQLSILAPVGATAWLGAEARRLALQRWLGAAALVVGLVLWRTNPGLVGGFVLLAGVLIGAALLLPSLLSFVLARLASRQSDPVRAWFWADTRAQLGGLSLALMALFLALSVNIGVGTMVDGFRKTFLGWLDQRLAAELYVGGTDEAEAEEITAWLTAREDVSAVLPIWNIDLRHEGFPLEVFGIADHPTYRENWPVLGALSTPWDRLFSGEATLLSEQFARRFDLVPGEIITIQAPDGDWALEIAGIYADYGNTEGQMLVALPALLDRWPEVEKTRFAVRTIPDRAEVIAAELTDALSLGDRQVVDQTALKALSRRIFETTFAVTVALNALTLAVAGLALFTSLLALSAERLPQLAPAWAMGLPRRLLGRWELQRTLALALFTALAAIPLGQLTAWILTAVINVEAFGWRLPLYAFPLDWARLSLLALVAAALASALPAWRLMRLPPARLLRLFSDDR
ncbi:MAG: FtsX-like permease family protein [Pseudomonadota bacterium]